MPFLQQTYHSAANEGGRVLESLKNAFSSPQEFLYDVVYPYMVPFFLFVILTPGLLLSLPSTSKADCGKIAPLPTAQLTLTRCTDGKAYTIIGGGAATTYDNVCAAQKKCNSLTMSKTVSTGAAFVHALVYVVGINIILYLIRSSMDTVRNVGYSSAGSVYYQ